jgi:hypothetical protein
MSRFLSLCAGIVLYCVAIVMAAGVIAAVIVHAPLAVRVIAQLLTGICLMAASGLVIMSTSKIITRAKELRLLAQDHSGARRDA